MGRAEDLLNGLQNKNTNNEINLLIAGENTDTEPHFVINDNRVISVPSELRTIAVQYDHNIETVTFDCPRYWDGHDMSKMVVYINYERADGETGAYLADNVRVDDEDESIMHFEWTISRNVTSASGYITFLVCIKSVDKSGDEQEHWNSERCSDISVAPGLETGEPIEEKYPDVLTQLSDKVENISKSNVTINDEESSTTSTYSSNKINTLVGAKADSTTVTQLSSKVGTLETTVGTKADTSIVNQQISSLQTELSNDISELEESVTGLSGDLTALETQVSDLPAINDLAASATSLYSSQKIESLVGAVDTKVSSKADQSALTALQGTVSSKADSTTVTQLSSKVDTLEETIVTKAGINDIQASATSTYSSNKINTLVGAKADSTTITQLSSKVGSLETTVGTKAAQTELDTLEETVSTLQTTVGTKADQSSLTALQTTVNNKADKSTVNAKQSKPTVKTITINTSNWSSGVYTLSNSLITATSIQEWCLPVYTGSNAAEINALQAANIVDAGQSAGKAKIRCLGTVPTVTVHMVVIFWG